MQQIWFVVAVGGRVVCYQYIETFPGYAEVQKKLFRQDGNPVLAVVRSKLTRSAFRNDRSAAQNGREV